MSWLRDLWHLLKSDDEVLVEELAKFGYERRRGKLLSDYHPRWEDMSGGYRRYAKEAARAEIEFIGEYLARKRDALAATNGDRE